MNIINIEAGINFHDVYLEYNVDINLDGVYFDRGSAHTLISFAGRNEHFGGYRKWNSFPGNLLLIRDPNFQWYCGFDGMSTKVGEFVLDNVAQIKNFIRNGNNFIVGQSSGGFAALLYSKYIANSRVFAFSPQTFSRNNNRYSLHFAESLKLPLLNDIRDIREHLTSGDDLCVVRNIFVGSDERENKNNFFWGDMLFAGNLIGLPNLNVFVTDIESHSVMEKISGKKFIKHFLHNNNIEYSKIFYEAYKDLFK